MATPGAKTIEQLTQQLKLPASKLVKTLLVDAAEGGVVALLVRGDHELNAVKAQKLPGVAKPLRMSSNDTIAKATGAEAGFLGPVGFKGKIYADHSVVALSDFVCGANKKDAHLTGVNWVRDLPEATAVDIRNIVPGDPSPSGKGTLAIARGIEVGHIFQLGKKYSESMGATVLDESGKAATLYMGCYGIGVTRVVAAAIEQNHDSRGIIWPDAIAPFQLVIVPINAPKSPAVRETAERLYNELLAAGVDVLLDDRDERPGVKFADTELIGIPHRVVVGDRGITAGKLEYRHRRAEAAEEFPLADAIAFIRGRLAGGVLATGAGHAHYSCPCSPLCLPALGFAAPAADAQREPELKSAVQHAIDQAECFEDRYDSAVWYKMMEPRLRKRVPDRDERMAILKNVFCEANRPGRSPHPARPRHGHHRDRKQFQSLRGLIRRRGRAHAGDALLAGKSRHAPPSADQDRGKHPHGLRHPAFLSEARETQRRARARALQRQHWQALVFRQGHRPVDALERRG